MSTNDKIYSYLRGLGLNGSINDMLYKWYSLKGVDEGQDYYLTRTSLFGSGQQGVWYDPSNLNTLFQDSAGTVPVTEMEQPVGRMLDLSWNGNHASQATSTKRGRVSRLVNLWTKTEQFDDAAWTKTLCTITANATTAPDGTATADLMVPDAASGGRYIARSPGVAGTTSRICVKSAGLPYVSFGCAAAVATLDFASGTLNKSSGSGQLFSVVALADDWFEVACTNTTATVYQVQCLAGVNASGAAVATDGVSGIYLWGASTTLSIDAHLPYQWVNTATDYDADRNKFPTYISFDGIDDALSTGNINFTSTDKMTVWAGVTKLSDAAAAVLYELSANTNTSPGSFFLTAPESTLIKDFRFRTRGSESAPTAAPSGGAASPIAAVVTGVGDISGDYKAIRLNGVLKGGSAEDQGLGPFGNYPLYIGARAGTSLYFNGRLYGLIVAGDNYPLSQTESVEYYMKRKMMLP